MRVSATYRCDNCGLEETTTEKGAPKGWGAFRWTEPLISPPDAPPRPPNGTITHVCSPNCRRGVELKYFGAVQS